MEKYVCNIVSSSVVEHLPSKRKALGSILGQSKKIKKFKKYAILKGNL